MALFLELEMQFLFVGDGVYLFEHRRADVSNPLYVARKGIDQSQMLISKMPEDPLRLRGG